MIETAKSKFLGDKFLFLVCLAIAVLFFLINRAGILSGWLYTPLGYEPFFANRSPDFAQYLTWANAFDERWFIPNYHAPWITEPALFNPVLALVSKISRTTGTNFFVVYHFAHLLAYLVCGYGLFLCLTTFTANKREAIAAIAIMVCSVPIASLLALPAVIIGSDSLPGKRDFLSVAFDGFIHAIPGSTLVTIGTATTLLSFGLVGSYINQKRERYIVLAALTTFVSALLHPFEVFTIVIASGIALVLLKELRAAVIMVVSGIIGLIPYILPAMNSDWLRYAAGQNKFNAGNPMEFVLSLGLPTVFGLAILAGRSITASPTETASAAEVLLRTWVVAALTLVYVPVIPWSQHLLDGYHCAIGMLVAVQLSRHPGVQRLLCSPARVAIKIAAGVVLILSLGAYATYWRQAFKDGASIEPKHHSNTIVSSEELRLINWLRENASPNELILAPPELAPWVAIVPMHSFGSHGIFSLTFTQQTKFARALYAGEVDSDRAVRVLGEYGVRYVVVPENARIDLPGYSKRFTIGVWGLFENPNNRMKRYRGRSA